MEILCKFNSPDFQHIQWTGTDKYRNLKTMLLGNPEATTAREKKRLAAVRSLQDKNGL
jgi:hypothetical protein